MNHNELPNHYELRAVHQHSLPGPESVTDTKLANGLRVLVRENHASPSVVVAGLVYGGSLYEPLANPGLASFTASMLERGTNEHSFAELSDELEAIGADIGFGVGRFTLGFDAKCLAEDASHVLGLLVEMLSQPSFPEDQLERLRVQVLTAIQQRDADTRRRSASRFRELAYGADHPYARELDGTAEAVAAYRRDDLATFYHGTIKPANGLVALVGAIPAEAALAALNQTLGAWEPPGDPLPRPVVPEPIQLPQLERAHVAIPGKSQADIVVGNPGIGRTHPDWLAANLANAVLGVFGLMGRLGKNVRERLGLAYYAYSRLAGGLGPGPWHAVAGVNPANTDDAIRAILDEMHRLRTEPVPDSDLADVKAFVTGSLPLRLETNAGVARALTDIALYDLGLDYLQRYPALVSAIEPVDVLRAAQAHLHPDRAAVAVAGPPA